MKQLKNRLLLTAAALLIAVTPLFVLAPTAHAIDPSDTLSSNALNWDTTDGDILATAVTTAGGQPVLVIGGNFTKIILSGGQQVSAQNFAVLNQNTGAVVYAGTGTNSYVRAIKTQDSIIYLGGDFTTFAGQSRGRIAALDMTNWQLTSLNPSGISSRVYAIEPGPTSLYVGGNMNIVRAYNYSDSQVSTTISADCSIHALLLTPDKTSLYIGGFQDHTSGFAQHGIAKVNATTGVADTNFVPNFSMPANSGGCGGAGHSGYDGEENLSLFYDQVHNKLVMGDGGLSNGFHVVDPNTAQQYFGFPITNDGQAVAVVGSTYLVGLHGDKPAHNFIAQYDDTGAITSWDPFLSGFGNNADQGNNGTQAMIYDPTTNKLFVAGSFLTQNGTPRQSLAVFTTTSTPPVVSAPTATTNAATSLTTTSATLNANVNPNNADTTYHFEYGPTASYGSVTSDAVLPASSNTAAVSANLSGLTQATNYHYRVVAANSAGTTTGSDQNFTTAAAPVVSAPSATATAATNATVNSATLNGAVNPNNADTTYHFEYGLTASYGTATANVVLPAGSTSSNVTANLTSLAANTNYHYRLVASNTAGTTSSADQSFTTLPTTPPPTQYLSDPGFETGVGTKFGTAVLTAVTSPVHGGTKALKVTTTSTAANYTGVNTAGGVTNTVAGKQYIASCWVMSTASNIKARVRLTEYKQGYSAMVGSPIEGTLTTLTPSVWTKISVTAAPTQNGTLFPSTAYSSSLLANQNSMFVDDCSVTSN